MLQVLKPENWSTSFRLVLSFIIFAFAGSFVLAMPMMTYPGIEASYFDHLLTAVSLVCVSGMAALPIGETYNIWGQMVALVMIQVGGLGVITIINTGLYYLHRRIPLKDQYILQAALNRNTNTNFIGFLFSIYRFTIYFELIAAAVIMIDFWPRYGFFKGAFNSIFLSVSAFTNSGFDNVGVNDMTAFAENPLILLTLAVLIIAGGLGFSVWFELRERANRYLKNRPRNLKLAFRNLSTHTRLVLQATLFFLVAGTLLIWISEQSNPATIGNASLPEQLMGSFFKSVSTRTAGYATFSYKDTQPFTKFIYMILTIIGGAPGGTAGGIKVTTIAILYFLFRAELKSYPEVVYNKRVLPSALVKQAVMVVLFFIVIASIGYGSLLLTHPHLDSIDLLFETMSSLGTLGVSLNVTEQLNFFGRIVIMIMTIAGRVGPITLLLAILQRKSPEVHYAETNVLIG